ncbi:DUF11 domain-containing protein [Methanococcoides burtonii]|uniref:DUF11 domain-containing protein n=1 Tax=Methanococcoides burtonii (strain DSM 6242 / NBRC 107633 / OCM 468 / ACE-M) TaxID=259564 RepID=Q12Z26_METBU|nr:DUF11 domain-containing protein [Methanococcoides burtonii]ABE51300.1 protein of unknown function DUF11 [Methanococcoides burtonii DSM 6242]
MLRKAVSPRSISLLVVSALLISLCLLPFNASAYSLDDVEWESSTSSTLYWGDTMVNGGDSDGYTIKAEDFTKDGYVHISLTKNNEIKDFSFIRVGQSFEYRDEADGQDIKISAKTVTLNVDEWTGNMEDPNAEIEIYRRGEPELEITIGTDKDEYDPKTMSSPQRISATFTVKNTGTSEGKNIKLSIEPNLLELTDGKLEYEIYSLEKGEVAEPITVKFKVPHLWEETEIEINAIVEAKDINNDFYETDESKTVTVEPKVELILTKSITKEIYMDETAHVLVSIRNSGIYSINSVTVKDSIIEGVELKDSITLEKNLNFEPGETKEVFSYSLKPLKEGTFTAPEATASFVASNGKEYTYESEMPDLIVNGPDIVITQIFDKTTLQPGQEVKVTVTARNEGNRDASTRVTSDQFPESATFISGDKNLDAVLGADQSSSYTYTLKMNELGIFKLSPATATFIDMEGFKGEKISNMPSITVDVPPGPEETSNPDTQSDSNTPSENTNINTDVHDQNDEEKVQPGFGSILVIATIAGVYLLRRRH